MALTRAIEDSTVVVTGASGGIGAATAIALAQRGANVVLAARRRPALEEVADRCRGAGGQAIAVQTDVRDPAQVERLAEEAIETFGHIDGWVNNAAVACYAPFGEAMPEFRNTIDTNLMGVAHGTAAALANMTDGGVIVNVGSVLSIATVPYLASYNAAKHAVHGLTDAVRQELEARGNDRISVCMVLPASVDTPLYHNAANFTGRQLRPPPPVYSPEVVADRIVDMLERPRAERYQGVAARLVTAAWRLMPGLSRRLAASLADRLMYTREPSEPSSGNVLSPTSEPSRVHGDWHGVATPLLRPLTAAARSATHLLGLARTAEGTKASPARPGPSQLAGAGSARRPVG
jgi:short-subunit dehydrogenase